MSNIFRSLFPVDRVKLLNLKEVQILSAEVVNIPLDLAVEDLIIKDISKLQLPIQSHITSVSLLAAEETFNPVEIPPKQIEQSQDIFEAIKLFPPETISIPIELIQDVTKVTISDNMLIEISAPRSISGMLYADRYWKTENITHNVEKKQNNHKGKNNHVQFRDLHEVNGVRVSRPRYTPSFWDLLFVLLQPHSILGINESTFLPHDLFPYQVEGVKFLLTNNHALLADDMGTGKTVMSTVALKFLFQANKIRKALVLCPLSVLYEWKRHLALWFPEAIACFVRGNQEIRRAEWVIPAHIYITTYDTLRSDIENGLLATTQRSSFDVVIIDEAHHIKNSQTSRSRAIRKLEPKYRWALTGTPIQNKVEDLAALFDFIHPGFVTSYDLYEERIKQKVAPYFLRRRKQDVLKDLPPKIKQDIWLEMSKEQRAEYDRVEAEIQSEIEKLGNTLTKQHIFAKMQRLKQVCNFPTHVNTSPKLDELKEQVEEIVASENKVIIFSQYVDQGIKKLETALYRYGVATIIGGQSDIVRTTEIERFKKQRNIPILLASVRSGGEGLNLTEASYVIHFDHWWNPAIMWQAEDRVHRRGQIKNVNVYSYWMVDSIDQRIFNILKRKGLLIQNVVDDLSENLVEELVSMDDLLEIMGVRKPVIDQKLFDPSKWRHLDNRQIIEKLLAVSPKEFEKVVERLMHYLGYPNVTVTGRKGDGGIDVISTNVTENGVERVAAQCKRYKGPIAVSIAREFLGAIQDNKSIVKGYLVTTSDFTPDCISFCLRNNIELINGSFLAEKIRQFGIET